MITTALVACIFFSLVAFGQFYLWWRKGSGWMVMRRSAPVSLLVAAVMAYLFFWAHSVQRAQSDLISYTGVIERLDDMVGGESSDVHWNPDSTGIRLCTVRLEDGSVVCAIIAPAQDLSENNKVVVDMIRNNKNSLGIVGVIAHRPAGWAKH